METSVPKKILMVDDEQFLLAMFKISLEKHGYEVRTFGDADLAIESLRAGYQPDIMFFDISMPNSRSGFEFIEAVTRDKLGGHAIKIAFTNASQDGIQERVAELGGDGYLIKSQFIPSELAEKIPDLLKSLARS